MQVYGKLFKYLISNWQIFSSIFFFVKIRNIPNALTQNRPANFYCFLCQKSATESWFCEYIAMWLGTYTYIVHTSKKWEIYGCTLNLIKTKATKPNHQQVGIILVGFITWKQSNPKNTGKGGSVRKKVICSIAVVQDLMFVFNRWDIIFKVDSDVFCRKKLKN